MNLNQKRINNVVEEYKTLFSDEYNRFCNAISDKRDMQLNEFASTGSDSDSIRQLAYEIPLTLNNMFDTMLNEEEKAYLKTKEGAEWFGRTNKDFSPAQKI